MTTAADPQIVPRPPPSAPALRAADQGVADALESVLSDNTRRVYGAQWRLFTDWCDSTWACVPAGGPTHRGPLPGRPCQFWRQHRHPAPGHQRIAKAHEWAGHESPGRDPGVREALKGWGRLGQTPAPGRRPHRRRLAVIRLTAVQPRPRPRVAITPAAMRALDAIRPVGVGGEEKVFGLSESQIARRVKAIAKAAGLADWEFFSGHSGRVGMARRMAQNGAPTHEIERQGRWKQGGGMVARGVLRSCRKRHLARCSRLLPYT